MGDFADPPLLHPKSLPNVFTWGWRRGYEGLAGPPADLAPWYAWAGSVMRHDLAHRYTNDEMVRVQRWTEEWQAVARTASHKSQVTSRKTGPTTRTQPHSAQLTSPASGWLGLSGDKTGRHNGHRRSASLHLGFAQTAVISITENYVGLEQVRGETT
jgi:hypothetical protein